jgi:hypothetical protein
MTGGNPSWADYAAHARRLDEIVREQEQDTAEIAARRETTGAAVTTLSQRLADQGVAINKLGKMIGQHMANRPATFTGVTDPAEALNLARRHADEADAAAHETDALARQPALMPGVSPILRNVLVYSGCALVAVLGGYGLLVASDFTSAGSFSVTLIAWMCTGLPAVAWIGGFLLLSVWGRPKLADLRTGQREADRSPKLGFVICFLALPLAFCAFKLITSFV